MLSRYNKAGIGCLLGGLLGPIGLIIAWTMRDDAKLDEAKIVEEQDATANAYREERECPYCAEPILAKARLCKHCGRDVEPLADLGDAESLPHSAQRNELVSAPRVPGSCERCGATNVRLKMTSRGKLCRSCTDEIEATEA